MPLIPLRTRKEVMEFLGISEGMLWKITNHPEPDERLTSYKFGTKRKYSQEHIDSWLERHKA